MEKGGDTPKGDADTPEHLAELGIRRGYPVTTDEKIDYGHYDLLHHFSILFARSGHPLPYPEIRQAICRLTLLIDYTAYDQQHRKDWPGVLFGFLSGDAIEYVKTIGRFIGGDDKDHEALPISEEGS